MKLVRSDKTNAELTSKMHCINSLYFVKCTCFAIEIFPS